MSSNNNKKRKTLLPCDDGDETNNEPPNKKQRIADNQINTMKKNKVKTIGTHDGSFHCDEVLACYMLSNHTKEFGNANIIRSRDANILSTADIIVDVGAEFDPNCNKFDHHQSGFCEQFSSDFATKLSSAGLIYKYFGKEIICDIIINHNNDIKTNMDSDIKVNENTLNVLYKKVYDSFIEGIDAIDNGIKQYHVDNEKRYKMNTDLSSRICAHNPWWNQNQNDEIAMSQFKKAMIQVGKELIEKVLYIYKGWLPAKCIVQNAIKNRYKVDKSGQILKLEQFCPWIEHFYELHKVNAIEPMPLYVLSQDIQKGWRIRAMPVDVGSFTNIKPLPKIWCGKRSDELTQICGINDCVFVHSNGFIGGNKTYDGALEMARKALQYKSDDPSYNV